MPRKILQKTLTERAIPGGRELELAFGEGDQPKVPALLQLPAGVDRVPAALLLHGFSSRKETLAHSLGVALVGSGISSLAIDLPLHGGRAGPNPAATRNPIELIGHWRMALREARLAIRYLAARPEIDRGRIGVVGYSLGSHVAAITAAQDPLVRLLVVAAGGDLPSGTAFGALARSVGDPLAAVRALSGRPLLMVHGRADRTVTPAQAQRLFDAASEPKEIRWYDAGHRLPDRAVADVIEWMRAHFS